MTQTSPAHVYSDVNKQLIQEGMEGSEEAGDAIKKIMPAYLDSNLPKVDNKTEVLLTVQLICK